MCEGSDVRARCRRDHAAGHLILTEAGGIVTDMNGAHDTSLPACTACMIELLVRELELDVEGCGELAPGSREKEDRVSLKILKGND